VLAGLVIHFVDSSTHITRARNNKLLLNFVPLKCLFFSYQSDLFHNSEKCSCLLNVHSVMYMLLNIRNVATPHDFVI